MNGDTGQWMPDPLTDRELEILRYISDGMADREIAQQLYLSLNTIKWHNRQIYSKLNVADRKQAVAKASDLGLFDAEPEVLPDAGVVPKHNLPASVTSFVGRELQLTEVQELLAASRLLTLCGPPGTGKTRLALRVAETIHNQFNDGTFFVDLAPITDPELVAATISEVLKVKEAGEQPLIESLQNALSNRQILLLLDNFEQVIEAAPLLTDLLAAAPELKMMVTSREMLHVYGEQIYPVPPLALPDLESFEVLEYLTTIEAIDLFLQRARSIKPDFVLNAENAHAVAETCTRLDGLPLAIELAAARVRTLSPQVLVTRLENRLDTLVAGMRDLPPRHQTLNATIDWSYDLLGEGEQQLLARLGAFQGGRTVEATEVVCGPGLPIDVLEGLESLLTKSLLQIEEGPAGEPRFYMLETIHEYARHRLAESGEEEAIRRRHAEFFLALAEEGDKERTGPNQARWLQRLRAEHDNLRTALRWSLSDDGDHVLALQLVAALAWFWDTQAQYTEGLDWCEQALQNVRDVSPHIVARALGGAAYVARGLAHTPERIKRRWELTEQGFALASEIDDKELIFWAYYRLGILAFEQRDLNRAKPYLHKALTISEDLGGNPRIMTLNVFGELARAEGAYERAREYYEKSIALARETGDPTSIGMLLGNLGYVARNLGDFMGAADLFREALLHDRSPNCTATYLAGVCGVCLELGQLEGAARLLGAVEANLEATAGRLSTADLLQFDRDREALKAQLSADRLTAALAEGRAMETEEAIAYALQES